MNRNTKVRSALAGVRRHPARAAAIGVPLLVAASVLAGTTMASAGPEADARGRGGGAERGPGPARDALRQRPARRAGAGSSWSRPRSRGTWTAATTTTARANVCVPWTIPGATPQAKCAWLTSNGFTDLKVYGTDRQDLPEDAQGYVCASGE